MSGAGLPVWSLLPPTGPAEPLDRQDPWLAIADATGFVDHGGTAPGQRWPVSVQVTLAGHRPSGVAGLEIRHGHDGAAHFTALATREAIAALAANPQVQRVQLAAPQVPRRPWPLPPVPLAGGSRGSALDGARPADVLLGIVDDGCPFLHPDLLRPDGTIRVLRLWQQDDASRSPGRAPAGFDYGTEFTRADLDALRAAHLTGGALDAAACHAAAGLTSLRHRDNHGAHVLGLLAGARRWRGSVRGGGPPVAPVDAQRASCQADIAFVQLPPSVLRCVSVPALEHHAVDGVRWLCNLARAQGYAQLVVVLAYESWLGPHDGSAWFETAMDELCNPARAVPATLQGLTVQLVLPAGNSRERDCHAQLGSTDGHAGLHWHLPPGNEDPMDLELWAPPQASALQVRLIPPGGTPSPWIGWGAAARWAHAGGTLACAVMHPSSPAGGGRPQLALRIAPTSTLGSGAIAPHGTWRLELQGDAVMQAGLHARIGRVEPALAVPRRNRQPHFVQRTPPQSEADRLNTLNGHATGRHVQVAGAFQGQNFPHVDPPAFDIRGRPVRSPLRNVSAAYSGAGDPAGLRQRPDASVVVEHSLLWPGVPSLGPTSASVRRLSGTSTAAPLLARALADETVGTFARAPSLPVEPGDFAAGHGAFDL